MNGAGGEPFRVLIVDDEPYILEGLERALRGQRAGWKMAFAVRGEEALDRLDAEPVDAIVSDMRMPDLDGAELMREVCRRHPEVIRMILTGHSDPAMIRRAVPVTHQFLAKPCPPPDLVAALQRVLEPRRRIGDAAVWRAVGRIERLPSSAETLRRYRKALARPEVGAGELGRIAAEDPAMSARVIQLGQSVYRPSPVFVADPEVAVARLGVDLMRSLEPIPLFEAGPEGACGFDDWIRHCRRTAESARQAAEQRGWPAAAAAELHLAGLLHELGALIDGAADAASIAARGDYGLVLWGFPESFRARIRSLTEPEAAGDAGAALLREGHDRARKGETDAAATGRPTQGERL